MKKNYQQPQVVVEQVETRQDMMLLPKSGIPEPGNAPMRFAPPIKVVD